MKWAPPAGFSTAGLKRAVAVTQQHAHVPAGRHGEVEDAVAIQVRHRHGVRGGAGGVVDGCLERTVPLAQQYAYVVVALVDHDEVGDAVAVEIPYRHGHGIGPDIEGEGDILEAARGAGRVPGQQGKRCQRDADAATDCLDRFVEPHSFESPMLQNSSATR